MVKCEFCDNEADFTNHYEQHLNPPRRINVCRACHMRIHSRLFRKKYVLHQGNIVSIRRPESAILVSVRVRKDAFEKFQEWCYKNGWSMSLATSSFFENYALLEKVLPFETAVKVATVATVEFLRGAKWAYKNLEHDERIYYDKILCRC